MQSGEQSHYAIYPRICKNNRRQAGISQTNCTVGICGITVLHDNQPCFKAIEPERETVTAQANKQTKIVARASYCGSQRCNSPGKSDILALCQYTVYCRPLYCVIGRVLARNVCPRLVTPTRFGQMRSMPIDKLTVKS